jgi:hypothetical protein
LKRGATEEPVNPKRALEGTLLCVASRAPLLLVPALALIASCDPIVLSGHLAPTPSAEAAKASAPAAAPSAVPEPRVERSESHLAPSPAAPVVHTGTIVPAKHPDRGACTPFQEGASSTCVAGFFGAMVVTDIDFGECADELMVLAVTIGLEAKVDVSHAHWYLLNPPHSRQSIHGAQFAVEATEELVFVARPANGVPVSTASGCFITWSSKVPATTFSYPRLE